MTLDYRQVSAFAAVIRTGSFDLAAKELAVTGSALSQRVRQLEERLGMVLILRGSPCRATAAGARLYAFAQETEIREHLLLKKIGSLPDLQRPSISIALNADSLASWFLTALDGCDGFLFDLVIDDQMDGTGMLSRGEVLAALTPGGRQVAGCDIWPLGLMRYIPVARPDFVVRHFPRGATLEALETAPTIAYDEKDHLQTDWIRATTGSQAHPPSHFIASSQGLYDAAAAGLGWVMMPHMLAQKAIARNELVRISDDKPPEVALNWQVQRSARDVLEDLTRRIRHGAKQHLLDTEAP